MCARGCVRVRVLHTYVTGNIGVNVDGDVSEKGNVCVWDKTLPNQPWTTTTDYGRRRTTTTTDDGERTNKGFYWMAGKVYTRFSIHLDINGIG